MNDDVEESWPTGKFSAGAHVSKCHKSVDVCVKRVASFLQSFLIFAQALLQLLAPLTYVVSRYFESL